MISLVLTGLSFRRWRRGWRKRHKAYPVVFTAKGWQPQAGRCGWCGGSGYAALQCGADLPLAPRAARAMEQLGFVAADPIPFSGPVTEDDQRRLMGLSDRDLLAEREPRLMGQP